MVGMNDDTDELMRLVKLRSLLRNGVARTVREGAAVSMNEMSRAVGVDRVTLLRWEHGKHSPRGELALKYLDVLEGLMKR